MKLFFQIVLAILLAVRLPAAPTLTDFWNGQGTWVKDSDQIGRNFGFHFLSFLSNGSELQAYYIHNYQAADGKGKSTIGRACSTDAVSWTTDGMVLDVGRASKGAIRTSPAWDDRLASFPGIWKDGDTWYLVYEGAAEDIPFSPGDIGLATSSDGTNFVKHPHNPILRHNPSDWERVNIGTPSLYKESGIWYLFYHGFDGRVCQIGVANGPSLTNLTRSAANPIVPVSPGNTAWDAGTTGKRSAIIKEGAYYYLAFEGSTPQPFDQAKWSSGLARSTNLTTGWTKYPGNPIVPQTSRGFGHDGPELLRRAGVSYLYLRAPGRNATERFRLEAQSESQTPKKP